MSENEAEETQPGTAEDEEFDGVPDMQGVLMANQVVETPKTETPAPTPEARPREVREVGPDETHLVYKAVLALGRRVASRAELADKIAKQRPEGFRIVGSFDSGDEEAAGFAGFRFSRSLAWGYFMYIDDMATREEYRGRGHAGAILTWLADEAKKLGCDGIHLDSRIMRHDAHRMYLNNRFDITSFHFSRDLKKGSG